LKLALAVIVASATLACSSGAPFEGLAPAVDRGGPKVVFDLAANPLPQIPFPNDVATTPDPNSPTGLRFNAAIGAAQAQVAQLTSEIDDSSLRAPLNGIIQLRLAEPGEVLGAGGRVLLLIDPSDQYMNLYLPASVVGRLTQGDDARVVLDALPEHPLPAKVAFVAAKSQFTPKEVETRDERQKLVFRVKLRLTEPAAVPQAKPGMPGAGYVRTSPVDWPANLK